MGAPELDNGSLRDLVGVFFDSDFADFERGFKFRCLADHRADAAVLFFGKPNSVLHGFAVDIYTRNHVMQPNLLENRGWLRRLVSLDLHLVIGYVHVLLAQDGNHIKSRAPGETGCDQLDRRRTARSVFVIDQQMMATSSPRHKLTPIAEGLC